MWGGDDDDDETIFTFHLYKNIEPHCSGRGLPRGRSSDGAVFRIGDLWLEDIPTLPEHGTESMVCFHPPFYPSGPKEVPDWPSNRAALSALKRSATQASTWDNRTPDFFDVCLESYRRGYMASERRQ